MNDAKTSSFHVVRQYGKQGGMENYVWELTHALVNKGHDVTVICEKVYKNPDDKINVVELGVIRPKPRWLSQLKFSKRVTDFFEALGSCENSIIHSHERTAVHHVTTIHGPSILNRKRKLLDFLSIRLRVWEFLERREVSGGNVLCVLPNSKMIAHELLGFYPDIRGQLCMPAYPGVSASFYPLGEKVERPTVGFIGREWKRKGLEIAVSAFKEALQQKPDIKLLVAGMPPEEVSHLFKNIPDDSYELQGWQKTEEFLSKINLLIHPALSEPFGMVVAEANAVGVPVLVSTQAGVADLVTDSNGFVLPPNSNDWSSKMIELLTWNREVESMGLSWEALANQCVDVYKKLG